MDELRRDIKRQLLEHLGKTVCPLCGEREAIPMHEIVYVPVSGGKYGAKTGALAEALFVKELCVLLCAECNERIGGGKAYQTQLLAYNIVQFGVEAVVEALSNVAKLVKVPAVWMPLSIEHNGQVYQVETE